MNQTWQSQFKDSIKSTKELASFLEAPLPSINYKTFIPISFAKRIKSAGIDSALWKQFIPSSFEEVNSEGLTDPIGDQIHGKGGGVIHRYKSRLLFNPTTTCPISCRYCFRKNELEENLDTFKPSSKELSNYLNLHPEVEEVILTGGDPLILSNEKISSILELISRYKNIRYIRFHTRTPIILPSRLDKGLHRVLSSFKKSFDTITIAIHTNHTTELTDELKERLLIFREFNLLSQTVLLKDVNSTLPELSGLFKKINSFGIKPYYLHHPDKVKGAMHFYMSIEEGRLLYGKLRDEIPGWLIPHYIVDSSNGHGKNFAYNPEALNFSGLLLDRFGQQNPY